MSNHFGDSTRKSEAAFTRAFSDLRLRAGQASRSGYEAADVTRLISAGTTLLRDYRPHLKARAPLSGYDKSHNLYTSLAEILGPIVLGSLVENEIMLGDHIDILHSLLMDR
jgi:hypothetical protein